VVVPIMNCDWTLSFEHPPTLCNYKNTLFAVSASEGCQGLNNTLPLYDILRSVAMCYCLDNMPCQGSRKLMSVTHHGNHAH
jgi:hypothetical protein